METDEQLDDPFRLLRLRTLLWLIFRLLCCAIGRHKWVYNSPKKRRRRCPICKSRQVLARCDMELFWIEH